MYKKIETGLVTLAHSIVCSLTLFYNSRYTGCVCVCVCVRERETWLGDVHVLLQLLGGDPTQVLDVVLFVAGPIEPPHVALRFCAHLQAVDPRTNSFL